MNDPEIHIAEDPGGAATEAAAEVLALIRGAIATRGRASIVLAGGRTPSLLYQSLSAAGPSSAPWNRVDFYFGDERCVPLTSPHSNYGLARRELLDPLGIPPDHVHRIAGETRPIEAAAAAYADLLRSHFSSAGPIFDLVLLGVGADGHTASLFPSDKTLNESHRWVRAVRAPAGYEPTERVTLTLPILNRARAVFFLALGAGKREVLASLLGGHADAWGLPAARVRPAERLAWFLDTAAAGRSTA